MEDTSQFNESLQKIIDEINETLVKLKQDTIVNPEILLNNWIFSVTDEEKDALLCVTEQIERILWKPFSSKCMDMDIEDRWGCDILCQSFTRQNLYPKLLSTPPEHHFVNGNGGTYEEYIAYHTWR